MNASPSKTIANLLSAAPVVDPTTAAKLGVGSPSIELLASDIVAVWPSAAYADDLAVVISCGIHGNETASIEIAASVLDTIFAGIQSVRRPLLFVFGNRPAMQAGLRYLDYDLNRLFGRPQRDGLGREAARAAQIESALGTFLDAVAEKRPGSVSLLCIDLHTSIRPSIYDSFSVHASISESGLKWINACELDAMVRQDSENHLFRSYCGRLQRDFLSAVDSFACELGHAKPFGANDLSRYRAVEKTIRIACDGGMPRETAVGSPRFEVFKEIVRSTEAFRLNLSADTMNFAELPMGMVLAEDGARREVVSEPGQRILFPKPGVAIGLCAGILLRQIS